MYALFHSHAPPIESRAGIVLWEIWVQQLPWQDVRPPFLSNKLYNLLMAGTRPADPADAPAEYLRLMHACWATTPASRPTFAAVLNDPLFRETGFGRQREEDAWCVLPESLTSSSYGIKSTDSRRSKAMVTTF